MRFTPDIIDHLHPNQIIVFGSNEEGRHGAGLARLCKQKWGAIYGQARGLMGQTYAIVTVDLRRHGRPNVPVESILEQVNTLFQFARANPDREILFTKIGCGLAGFTFDEIFRPIVNVPTNVVMPKEYYSLHPTIRADL